MKSKKIFILVIAVLLVAVAGVVGFIEFGTASSPVLAKSEATQAVKKDSIKVEVTASGVIDAMESYDLTSLVPGKILSAPYEEGDKVNKGDILYKFDSTDIEANIQKTQNSIAKLDLSIKDTKLNLDKTIVYAGTDGRLTNFNVKENETIATTKIGDIVNDGLCIAKIPFSEAQVSNISVGQSATVYSAALMSSINGTVSKINNYPIRKANGAVMYIVEISVDGINSLAKDAEVTAQIGSMESSEAGKIDVPDTYSVSAAIAGRVKKVYVSNNDYVTQGQKILELENDTYVSALDRSNLERRDLLIALETYQKQFENYTIKSPLDGVIVKKSKKVEDSLSATTLAQVLMTVANTDKLKLDMKIDEMDIGNVKIGQSVKIESDVLPGKSYVGKVTLISEKGTVTNNVSMYQVQVTIDDKGELKPGMNVNAKIAVSNKENILTVPVSAVIMKDGKTLVNLPADENGKTKQAVVETGIRNNEKIEIVKGLNEGDKIIVPTMAKK